MKLIQLSKKLAINPESIDAIEVGKGTNNKMTLVHTRGGKTFSTDMPAQQLLQSIEFASESKWEGFFAG